MGDFFNGARITTGLSVLYPKPAAYVEVQLSSGDFIICSGLTPSYKTEIKLMERTPTVGELTRSKTLSRDELYKELDRRFEQKDYSSFIWIDSDIGPSQYYRVSQSFEPNTTCTRGGEPIQDLSFGDYEDLQKLLIGFQESVIGTPERKRAVEGAIKRHIPSLIAGVFDDSASLLKRLGVRGRCRDGEPLAPVGGMADLLTMGKPNQCPGLKVQARIAGITAIVGLTIASKLPLYEFIGVPNDPTRPDIVMDFGGTRVGIMDIDIGDTKDGPRILFPAAK